jgi:DNA-directed RNA polymerase specialized sigma24 family protein
MSTQDELLHAYLHAREEESAEALAILCERVLRPACRVVARGRLGRYRDYVEDVTQDALARIVSRLQTIRADGNASLIKNVTAWTMGAASSVCSDFLRKEHPLRTHLANALRYRLERSSVFPMWTAENRRFVCGWRKCRNVRPLTDPAFERVWALPRVAKELATVAPEYSPALWRGLATLFACADGPIYFQSLISSLMRNSVTVDRPLKPLDNIAERPGTEDPEQALIKKDLLKQLWEAAVRLPEPERLSVLLGLQLAALWEGDVVTRTEVVSALRQPLEVLERTPLANDQIADILKLNEPDPTKRGQYVANRRRDAKRQLAKYFESLLDFVSAG